MPEIEMVPCATIPRGLCQCGCGRKTSLALSSNTKRGWIRGEPVWYVRGHAVQGRKMPRPARERLIDRAGYVRVRAPEHPNAHNGYVHEHVLVASKALGRAIPEGAQVHHVNEMKADNRPANLVICQDDAYHKLLHQRLRALRECGHPDWLRCTFCGRWDPREALYVYPGRNEGVHRACRNADFRERRQRMGWAPMPAPLPWKEVVDAS